MGEEKKRHRHSDMKEQQDSPEAPAQARTGDVETETASGGIPVAEYEAMQKELDESRSKANEYFDGWQRERADFMNYKRRIDREQSQMAQNITGNIVKKYLVVLDDLERALKARPNVGEGGGWAEGIELIYRKLQGLLEAEGVTRMQAEGETFDPNRHEAISHEDSPNHKSGEIIEVVQPGYMIGDRVLRPALVRVAR